MLARAADFRRVYKEGRRYRNALLVIYALPHRAEPPEGGITIPRASAVRLGLSVGKWAGNAVKRNRLRRRLREACRTLLLVVSSVEPPEGAKTWDLVVVPGRPAAEASFQELQEAFRRLLCEAGVLPADG